MTIFEIEIQEKYYILSLDNLLKTGNTLGRIKSNFSIKRIICRFLPSFSLSLTVYNGALQEHLGGKWAVM